MSVYITTAKLTGNPDARGWVQIHDFTPENSEKLKSRGRLFAVIATEEMGEVGETKQEIDGVAAGREILARLHEEYYGNTTLSAFNALNQAVERVIGEFQDSLGTKVEIAATALMYGGKSVVYSAVGGGARVSLLRGGAIANLLESKQGKVVSASGHPKEGDILYMGTSSFFMEFRDGLLKEALGKEKLDQCLETLAPSLHTKSKSSSMGVVFIKFLPGEKKDFQVTKTTEVEKIESEEKQKREVKETAGDQEPKSGLKLKLAGVVGLIEKKIPRRKLYIQKGIVDVGDRRNRKVAMTVGLILLGLLVVSIVFGVRKKSEEDLKASYESDLTQAQHELEEAMGLVSLNRERARELFVSSRSLIESIEDQGIEDERVASLREEIDKSEGAILGEFTAEVALFIDLSLLSDGFSGDDMAASLDKLYVLDKSGKKIIEVEIDSKGSRVIAGPEKIGANADGIVAYADRVFVINDNGVKEIDEGEVLEKDWSDGSEVYAYAGNLYILDKSKSDVLRFPGITDGFGSGKSWLAPGIELNLSGVESWTIDGSIWLLFDDGDVTKLLNGASAAYSQSGIAPELASAEVIYTNEELENVYILDKTNKRIVVTDKEGEFVAQYLSDQIGQVKDIAVSEKEGKIILLTNGKLMAISLGGDGGN